MLALQFEMSDMAKLNQVETQTSKLALRIQKGWHRSRKQNAFDSPK
jgi:hypothetical protein